MLNRIKKELKIPTHVYKIINDVEVKNQTVNTQFLSV